ncbi:spermine synthase [Schizophyllum commune H4-8]|uniref:spermine synthase n=1 Tax=Schizophyllum commune (strain H4-8 / FGSC 9210) TaxID=578458 RepID=UPI00215F7126|nr:spermine synthase [Schizophyllum commune H4-8]KAI5892574.1 spermine synthase [Schizophyllum commune H4-8]
MVLLSHPSIRDGWFRETSSQWPGQAMSLKVNRILHVEKSTYQDVLVFESATYGNVLVLDGVIQCTERDEFSYQEMITHLPLASHPCPKQVLVVGGGDGGVVREVLKYDCVEQVVLCDIDEAVIRVSKQYLPHMSSLLASPKVTVHIGDGFSFLADNRATYDVIITDSSDPVGPAESLFQKPYFELLHAALAPGGTTASQSECLWLHLPLIKDVVSMARDIFPVVEYAYTTIPTYPSGQIGFLVCSKDADGDLRSPARAVPGTAYYNADVHRAAFVLPEFARSVLGGGPDVLPKFGREAKAALIAGQSKRTVLLLGSGFVALPCAEYITRDPRNALTIACRTLSKAQKLAAGLPAGSTTAVALDVSNTAALESAVAAHDLVISLIPYTYHTAVIRAATKSHTNVLTTSFVSPAIRALEPHILAAGITVMNEIGVDPGVDHLYAVKFINEAHAKGGKIREFYSFCGGLPAPEAANNPLGFKFSWSARGVLLALLNSARFLEDGKLVEISGPDVVGSARPYFITPALACVAYPNRDATQLQDAYGIPAARTVKRGSLRFQGFCELARSLMRIGWLRTEEQDWLVDGLTWAQISARSAGAKDANEASLVAKIKELSAFSSETEATQVLSGMQWIGLFSNETAPVRSSNLLDTLCARLEEIMAFEPGERDLVLLQHKFVVEWSNGEEETFTSTLEQYGSPIGHSAMAFLVGTPCGIAAQLMLDGVINKPGILAPYTPDICDPIRALVEQEGIGMVERKL